MTKGDHCRWENIGCSDDGSVEILNFQSIGLQGTISTSIGLLWDLTEMTFGEYNSLKINTVHSMTLDSAIMLTNLVTSFS